jgi:hypothetical protein
VPSGFSGSSCSPVQLVLRGRELALQIRQGEVRQLDAGLPRVPALRSRNVGGAVPDVVALQLRQRVGILHRVEIRDHQGRQPVIERVVVEAADAQILEHVRDERAQRQIEDAKTREREVIFVYPRCTWRRCAGRPWWVRIVPRWSRERPLRENAVVADHTRVNRLFVVGWSTREPLSA